MISRQFIVIVSLGVTLFMLASCISPYDRAPDNGGYYCVEAYHSCDKCGSLTGGNAEKGPWKYYSRPDRKKCIHEWQKITREEFKRKATADFGVDWNGERAVYWNHDNHD